MTLCVSLENVSNNEFNQFTVGLVRLKGLFALNLKLISIEESVILSLFTRVSSMKKLSIFSLNMFTNMQRVLDNQTMQRI